MARTADEILASFQLSATNANPGVDASKGPLYSIIGYPFAQTLAPTETLADTVSNLYSAEFAATATNQQAQAFVTNWGESAGLGTPSTGYEYFMTFTQPQAGTIITIPVGAVVSNSNQTLQFLTTEGGQILGNQAASYYNPSRRSWEIGLNIQAAANSPSYQLPIGVINTLITSIPGIDAVENRAQTSLGSSAESPQQQVTRVQNKFFGTAINTPNGAYTRITSYDPTDIMDVKAITSSDHVNFTRLVTGNAIDYYILGEVDAVATQTYTSIQGGETQILLTNVPTVSINSVTINNVPLSSYVLQPDLSPQTGLSAIAQDMLVLPAPLIAGDVVQVNVTYNQLIQNVQQNVFDQTQLFIVDELARSFFPLPISITLSGRALANYDPATLTNEILTATQNFIQVGVWQEQFFPNNSDGGYFQYIQQNVQGVSNLQLTTFQSSIGALSQIEVVNVPPTYIATYNPSYINVSITST